MGAHLTADCIDCHAGGYAGTPTECAACHITDYNQTTDPNHVESLFATDCAACHTETSWVPSTFDHNAIYPFTGAHIQIADNCNACHIGNYANTPNTCSGCHMANFDQATNPNHNSLGIPTNCEMCHTTAPGWDPATFPIHNNYYALNGAHATIANDCATCHNGNYNNTPNTCAGCHTPDYNQTTAPNHAAAQFPTECAACHTETAWIPSTFDHNAIYPFTGAHIQIADDCNACHNGNYTNTPNTCAGCHTTDFNQTTNPNHVALGIPTNCEMCHTTAPDWEPATFPIHDNYYALNGAHATIANDCATCHNGNYTNTPNTCAGCHTPDYNQTTDPNHVAAQFSTDCATCHAETTWEPATFDHDAQYFPIYSGAHEGEWDACVDCHTNPSNYAVVTCTTCHTNPETNNQHNGVGGYAYNSPACLACHPTGDAGDAFDHNTSGFPLMGAHLSADCLDCHASGYAGTPTQCAACHTTDYNQTTNPNHVAAQFPTDCATCHSETAWIPSTFDHNAIYPFTGAHIQIADDCNACHNGNYTNTPNTCAGCHTTDFNQTTNPNHVALGIPTNCEMCHTTAPDWEPATFPIHDNYYALNGAHATIANDCATCHNGNYTNTPNTCAGCHTPDYNQTTDPNHVAAQFSTDCATCHSETAWEPANFDHDAQYFPIYSGAHEGEWDACVDCHTNPANYAIVTCTTCHTNPETNNQHNGIGGYAYNSPACLACHPTGDADDAFDHNTTNFPLQGAHLTADCLDCHASGYAGTPTECAACHTTDYNQTTNPNHAAAQFPTDCATCHSETGWIPSTFDHNAIYPFTGAHIQIADDCNACHNGNYTNTPNTCAGCHTTDFNQTTNPNHVALGIPTNCEMCHTTAPDWEPASFPIHDNYYALNGAHITIANDCAACHNGNYTNTPNTCAGCHTPDYNQTTDPNHIAAQFSTDCATCHSETAWEPANFDHDAQYFPIYSGAHEGEWDACVDCHTNPSNYAVVTCTTCHTNPETNNQHNGIGGYAYNSPACLACHPTGDADDAFDHNTTNFPLQGAHLTADCLDCHAAGYAGTPTQCAACHTTDYNQTTNPNHAAAQFPTDCATCHSESGWIPSTFDHNAIYPFTGAHIQIADDCNACHNGNYTNTPNTCAGCHTTDYNQSVNPNHVALGIPTNCEMCHTTAPDWEPASFPIHNNYYALNGAHAAIANDCESCHNGNYNNTPNTCAGCHTTDYNQTTNPNHAAAQFPTDCATCHGETAWIPSTFDHNVIYPFTGAHIQIADDCNACHNGNYTNTPNTCAGCHTTDFNQTTNPNHVALGIPTNCEMCHTTAPDWEPATFPIHDNYYALNGAHITIANDCAACHNGNYTNTPNTCAGCHTPDYNQTTDPNHVAAQFSTDCAACHSETAWEPANFDHDAQYFPIYSGAHEGEWDACVDCHTNPSNYAVVTCTTCHTNPETNNQHNGIGGYAYNSPACLACHPTGDADDAFDHNTTNFPLQGAHLAADCLDCHASGYAGTPTECAACHTTDYNQTTNPNHAAAQFPTDCATCHGETAWIPSTFDHNVIYPFTGAHIQIADDCNACHNGNYTNTPNTCAGCHTTDFNQTTNPNHVALGIPTNCEMCHTTAPDWEPATFPIHDNYYALNGAHITIANDCAACHNGNYTNTPNTCAGCHTPDYNQTTDPNHVAAQFSTDCAACHSETAWEPANFDHDAQYFPIYSGAHEGEWDACVDCHTNPSNYAVVTCTTCHTNPETNNQHNGIGGYAYNSPACLACHPTGDADDAFDHNTTNFPLQGAHLTADCLDCHASGYAGTPTECAACHTTDYNQTTNPNHAAAQFPTDCATCHSESGWIPSTFDHNAIYPFTGTHIQIADDCNACHNGNYTNTPNTCAGCHTTDYNQSVNPNHIALGIPTNCEMCHTTAPDWEPASFPIHNNYYALNGAHAAIANDCESCHNGNYTNTPNTCAGCHTTDYNQTTSPNHAAAQFPTECAACHSETAWVPSTFDHNAIYPFTGAHVLIANDCDACHNGNYTNTPNTCAGCHTTDYNQSINPNHLALGIPTNCEMCHTTAPDWEPASFPIHNNYYALNGAHAAIANDCESCHNGNYTNTPNTCAGCHTTDYNQTTSPNHAAAQFPTECAACHSETAWVPSTFDHNAIYPFTGAHIQIADDCDACHNGNYTTTPNTCAGCHTTDYNQSVNPNHLALGIPTNCEMCHTTAPDWEPASFPIHNNYYALNGAHAAIANDCESCHNGNYTNTPNTCAGCHTTDYNQTTSPNHAAAQFPTECAACHTETAWVPSTFDHNAIYPFTGAHIPIANDCDACHNGNYTTTPNTCAGCHTTDYNQSVNPNHLALGIPTNCEMCHTTNPDWDPATFPIHNNYYALNGAHAAIANDCATCHNGNYNNTPNTCAGCHTTDYNQTTNPNHAAAQFPTDCAACHSETAWIPSTFDHNEIYPFTGAHIPIANDCDACHNGNYTNTPNTCAGCHTTDYNQSVNPNHLALGIPTNCEMCHTTNPDWDPATFPIHNNYYVLSGAHAVIANDCAACHNGNYTNTPNTCVGCHLTDYNQTNDPNHAAAQFPTDCAACHTQTAWDPSTFDHDDQWFPIYSGKHDGEWDQCVECHTTPGNFMLFSCIDCHEHDDPADLADKHQDVSGYQYNSQACYTCHPNGEN
jgi:hypothetical protein